MKGSMQTDGAYRAGSVDRIPLGEGRTVRIAGVEVAVFRTRSGEAFAVQSACPHMGGPLADGLVLGHRIACPLHGHTFDLPTGQPLANSCPALKTYPVEVDWSGEMWVKLPTQANGTVDLSLEPDFPHTGSE